VPILELHNLLDRYGLAQKSAQFRPTLAPQEAAGDAEGEAAARPEDGNGLLDEWHVQVKLASTGRAVIPPVLAHPTGSGLVQSLNADEGRAAYHYVELQVPPRRRGEEILGKEPAIPRDMAQMNSGWAARKLRRAKSQRQPGQFDRAPVNVRTIQHARPLPQPGRCCRQMPKHGNEECPASA
jgi:hypothetical protein